MTLFFKFLSTAPTTFGTQESRQPSTTHLESASAGNVRSFVRYTSRGQSLQAIVGFIPPVGEPSGGVLAFGVNVFVAVEIRAGGGLGVSPLGKLGVGRPRQRP